MVFPTSWLLTRGQERCMLLELPAELRLRIYDFVLPQYLDCNGLRDATYDGMMEPRQANIGLLRSCRLINSEVVKELYKQATVCVASVRILEGINRQTLLTRITRLELSCNIQDWLPIFGYHHCFGVPDVHIDNPRLFKSMKALEHVRLVVPASRSGDYGQTILFGACHPSVVHFALRLALPSLRGGKVEVEVTGWVATTLKRRFEEECKREDDAESHDFPSVNLYQNNELAWGCNCGGEQTACPFEEYLDYIEQQ